MIKSIKIKNFMAHSSLSLEDIPPINIIIGKNDTGKTGILKLLYSTVKSLEIYSLKKKHGDVSFKRELAEKLIDVFMPRKQLGDLVQKGSDDKLDVTISITDQNNYNQDISFAFGSRTESTITTCLEPSNAIPDGTINALFVPAKEVLTAFNDISSIRELHYGKGFDDTYFDLIKALRLETTKGRVATELSTVNKVLEDLFEGKIEQTGQQEQPFIFKKGNQQFSMQQTAEGIKKIGILTTLINNRQLGKGTVLFMDEPETALHPDAIRKMVEMLVAMSKAGVQIFIASHSYFIIKQMALCAKRDKLAIKCWNLEKEIGKPLTNSFHDLIDGILPDNSIINESLAMYNDDIKITLGL
ncbi:MAG: AAA family ATPase [Spirosomataceae bacterium]|jgi:AAA15 family ATPase/GTPase